MFDETTTATDERDLYNSVREEDTMEEDEVETGGLSLSSRISNSDEGELVDDDIIQTTTTEESILK